MESLPPAEQLPRYLEHLLRDRRTADYLAERFARSWVGTDSGPFLFYRRRRFVVWLADQLHENRPYDVIVRDLITAEGIWTHRPAANFITNTLTDGDAEQPDENKLASRLTRSFLAIRLDCAQCHDHPFDEQWKQEDFQALAAYFAQLRSTAWGIRDSGEPYQVVHHESGESHLVDPGVPFEEQLYPHRGRLRHRLANWITHTDNQAFARATVNRVWTLMFGLPLVEPVDDIPLEGPYPPALEILAHDFADHGFNLRRLIRGIAATAVFQLDSRAEHPLTAEHDEQWAAFPLTRLRGEQVAGALLQSASLTTIDHQSHVLIRLARFDSQNNFLRRYGDAGPDELEVGGGTIPQRLLMMNGNIVRKVTQQDLMANAASRIAALSPDHATAVETAYLALLTRRPTETERTHFVESLHGSSDKQRHQRISDLYWSLLNSTEFSWNH